MDIQASDAATGVLSNLVAADLVTHEMIGDPARLDGEAACLRALCSVVGGSSTASIRSITPSAPARSIWAAGSATRVRATGRPTRDGAPGDPRAGRALDQRDAARAASGRPEEDGNAAGARAPVTYLRAFAEAAGVWNPPSPACAR